MKSVLSRTAPPFIPKTASALSSTGIDSDPIFTFLEQEVDQLSNLLDDFTYQRECLLNAKSVEEINQYSTAKKIFMNKLALYGKPFYNASLEEFQGSLKDDDTAILKAMEIIEYFVQQHKALQDHQPIDEKIKQAAQTEHQLKQHLALLLEPSNQTHQADLVTLDTPLHSLTEEEIETESDKEFVLMAQAALANPHTAHKPILTAPSENSYFAFFTPGDSSSMTNFESYFFNQPLSAIEKKHLAKSDRKESRLNTEYGAQCWWLGMR